MRLGDEASNFEHQPLVSVLLPVFNPEWERLEWGLDSLMGQAYTHWELCVCSDGSIEERAGEILDRYERLDRRIKVTYLDANTTVSGALNAALSLARGEFVGLLAQGDELAPDALFEVVKLLQEHPKADLVYSDVDEVDGRGDRTNPYFKPGWSPDLLLSENYVSDLSVYRKSLLKDVGGFREGFDGCQDYDLVLRTTERTDEIHHVPKVLYHRAKPGALASPGEDKSRVRDRTRLALSEALERRGLGGSVEDGYLPNRFRAKLKINGQPKVSVVIPTRDNVSFLKRCVESVERLTTYRNYELLIIDNNSRDRETVEYLASVPHRVIPFREPFNYSRINNFAVSQADGEYILFLNDDTEAISGEWLEAMLEHAQRPEVGAVGARLIYPDGRIQHAGVVLGAGSPWESGVATHAYQFYSSDSPGYAGGLMATTNYSAVTAACMLLRRSLFGEVGGFDEENLRVQFNDVDLCLRIREQGYYVVYTPYAELYHHESVSRGHWSADPAENVYMRKRWGEVMDKDPFYNPNFSRGHGDFNLRADLLRPKVLRQEAEQAQRSPVSWLKNPWEHQRYMEAQYRAVRSSPRTTIVPKLANDTPTASRQRQEGSPRLASHESAEPGLRKAIRAEQLIWMFGSARTGSTWLSWMMAELENQERWHEPFVGLLFGGFLYERLKDAGDLLNNPTFIMGEPYREVWLRSIRNFVLEGAAARYPELREDQYLVIKEPNGSVGAPLLSEATPDSRLIFLIRDSRDVVASRLDSFREGSWARQNRDYSTADKLNAHTQRLAEDYLRMVSKVQEAYDGHPGKKAFVRYEDLRYDTINVLKAMYDALEVEADEAQLEAAVAKHSWARIPDEDKGKDKFFRKAQTGSWRDDLSPEQIKIIEDTTGPLLSRYY